MNSRMLMLGAAWATLTAGALPAAEVDYVLRAGLTHSDNIERLPEGQERGTRAATAGVELQGLNDAGRLRYDVDTDLTYYDYLNLDIGSELLGHAALAGAYHFVPERFSWNASLNYGQVSEDILRPLAVGNREDELRFSTGPTLRARFGGAMEGQFDARYSRLDYSERPFDNETLGVRATLGRRSSPRSLLAVGYSYDDVSYASAASGFDYERQEVFVRSELKGVRTDLNLEAGYTDVSGAQVDDGGALLRATLNRRMTPSLTGSLAYVREYPTSEPTPSADASTDSSSLTAAPRRTTSMEAGLRFERPRTSAELAFARREESALVAGGGEREVDELRANVTRRFTPRASGGLQASLSHEKVGLVSGRVDEALIGAHVGMLFGRAMGVDLRLDYRDRDGFSGADDYSEFSAGLFFRYGGAFGRRAP
jgi:hypothetical protein